MRDRFGSKGDEDRRAITEPAPKENSRVWATLLFFLTRRRKE
jgi:hypothetical protein